MSFGVCPWLGQGCPHFDADACHRPEAEKCIHVVSARAEAWIVTAVGALSGVLPSSPSLRTAIEEVLGAGAALETREEIAALSGREVEVLRACLEGGTNKEVGERLHISVHTVRNHMKSIYEKLAVRSRTELFSRYSLLRARSDAPPEAPRAETESKVRGQTDEAAKQIEL